MPKKVIKRYLTVFGKKLKLVWEKEKHILQRHPEVRQYLDRLLETLNSPDIVKLSKKDKDFHLYYKYFSDIYKGKFLLAVVNARRASIATVFITDKIKAGVTIWKK